MKKLPDEHEFPFTVIMKNGTMSIGFFAAQATDTQTPHKQDEIYTIAKGHGSFYRDGERVYCKKDDMLFVPAGMEHQFENFSDDFLRAGWGEKT
jgi:mannose-6-phosphate isomerase-like protein (cupin superfamily)